MSNCEEIKDWDIKCCCQSCHKDEEINGESLIEFYVSGKRLEVCCKVYRFLKESSESSKG